MDDGKSLTGTACRIGKYPSMQRSQKATVSYETLTYGYNYAFDISRMEMRLMNVHLGKFVFVFDAKYPQAPRAFRPIIVYFTNLGTCCSRRRYCGDSFRTVLFSWKNYM